MSGDRRLEHLQARYGERYRWLVLFTSMVGTIASVLASTIVNVAVPAISARFDVGQAQVQWVSAGFMLAMTSTMLLTPWLLQRFGLRRTYSGTIAMLSLGAMAGGLSGTFWLVLAMRVVEGLAAGVLQTIPSVVVMRAFGERERGRAIGIFGFGVVLAPALGPTVGGVLVELYGWRSVFFVMLPFGALGLAMARRYLPLAPISENKAPLDWPGLLLVSLATLSLLNGLAQWQANGGWPGPALLALGVIALSAFVVRLRSSSAPLMNVALFRDRTFAVGATVSAIYGASLFGSTYLIPLLLQLGLGEDPSRSGMALLPAGLLLALALPVTGRLSDRWRPDRMVSAGLLLLAASFALMASIGPATPYVLLVGWVAIGRIGLAFVLPALTLASMAGLGRELIPQGASALNFLRQVGGALGVSLAGIALEWRLEAHGVSLAGTQATLVERLQAFDETFMGLGAACAAAALLSLRMRRSVPRAR